MLQNEKLFKVAHETLKWLNENGFENKTGYVTINRDLTVKEIKIKKTLTKKQKKIIADQFPNFEGK